MTIYSRSEELLSRCVECDLAEPESLASLDGSAPGLVDGILSKPFLVSITFYISEDVRTWFSVINLTYSSLFWDTGLQGVSLVYQQRRI